MATKMSLADLQLVEHGGEWTQRVAAFDEPYHLSVHNALIPPSTWTTMCTLS